MTVAARTRIVTLRSRSAWSRRCCRRGRPRSAGAAAEPGADTAAVLAGWPRADQERARVAVVRRHRRCRQERAGTADRREVRSWTCGSRPGASPSARRACGLRPTRRRSTPTGARCCPGCTTIMFICGRWPPRRRASRSGRNGCGPRPSWRPGCARPTRRLPAGAWLRCVGYHESVAGPLDRWALDRLLPNPARPGAGAAPDRRAVGGELGRRWPRSGSTATADGHGGGRPSKPGWSATPTAGRPDDCGGWTAGSPTASPPARPTSPPASRR